MSVTTRVPSLDQRSPRTGMEFRWRADRSLPLLQLLPDLVTADGSAGDVIRGLRAPMLTLPKGPLALAALGPVMDSRLGVLILDGFLVAGLDGGRAHVGWLVGAGDLVRGSELAGLGRIRWEALTPVRIALLDSGFEQRAWTVPQVMSALFARAQRTTQSLLATLLLVSSPLVEERMRFLFELLARRWGQLGPDGMRVELPLTHALIARLVGARRPTVTMTLHSLEEQGLVRRESRRSWLVRPVRPIG